MPKLALPTHADFGRLRLHHFIPRKSLVTLGNWEYLDHEWVGEANGFTAVLQLASDQTRTRSVEVDLVSLPADISSRLLASLGLPLRRSMTMRAVSAVFGKPTETMRFVRDRVTKVFEVGPPRYFVQCTLKHRGGLIFVSMHTRLPKPALD